jgi:outer membrane lipoprotein SlyB
MKKMTALLLTILLALSFMGCATTQDKSDMHSDQSYYHTRQAPGGWQNTSNP